MNEEASAMHGITLTKNDAFNQKTYLFNIQFLQQKVCHFFLTLFLLAFSSSALAVYTFPDALPPGCSGSGGNYTCGDLDLSQHIAFNDSGNVNIYVYGDMRTNGINVGTPAQAANVTFHINSVSPRVEIRSMGSIYANLNISSSAKLAVVPFTRLIILNARLI